MDNQSSSKPQPNWIEAERALSVEEAARYCGISASYLNKLRIFGGGPTFSRAGRRVTYSRQDLDDFRNASRFSSTSEYPTEASAA